ncbi:MAG: site-specific integrase [Methanomassiliicoccales archaeon]|nr:MAG: site-specific integrase [Methanomassiliicoccales archaeon]
MKPAKIGSVAQGGASKTVDKFTGRIVDSSLEGKDAALKRSGNKPSVIGKKGRPGRRRGARSLGGRYPFLSWLNKLLKSCGLAEATIVERRRRLKRIYKDLLDLQSKGKIETTNPEKMSEKDVGAFVDAMCQKGKKGKDFEHDMTALNTLLKYANNLALESYKNKHASQFRRSMKVNRHPSLSPDEYARILDNADKVETNDWNKMESYAIVILGMATGARHKELREGKLDDLTLTNGNECYHIEHPKGEDTYGQTRDTVVMAACVKFLKRYREKRLAMLARYPDNLYLFPAFRDKLDGKLSTNSITKMVRMVGKECSVEGLDLHKCRRTFGQKLLDEEARIESVSVLMGHATTAMTEKFYCRRKQQQAINDARNLMGNVPSSTVQNSLPDTKNPLIDKKYEMSGYA